MVRIRRILVPTDFSAASLAALTYARVLQRKTGASVIALHVIAPVHYVEALDAALLVAEARQAAERHLMRLKPAATRTVVKRGIPHQVVVDTARELKADLIVIGTHGRSGFRRLMLGSVTENVVRHSPCPVLTVRTPSSGQ